MSKAISIIIPTYNERNNIIPLVKRINQALSNYDYEIVFIDDNSSDGTAELVGALSPEYPVKVIVRKNERGLSSAVVDGIGYVTAEIVVVMDADLQHPPEIVPELFEQLDTHDLVFATRVKEEGWSLKRKFVSLVANLLALPLCPRIKDRTSGFFGFRRAAVDAESLSRLGWKIGLEVAVRGCHNSVAQVPYNFALRKHGESKLTKRVIWEYLKQLVALYLYKFRMLRFMLVGASGLVVNLVTLWLIETFVLQGVFASSLSAALSDYTYLIAFVPAFLLAVVNNYIWNSRWTFGERSAGRVGFPKYLLVASATFPLDEALLYIFTDWIGIWYVLSAAIAIIIVFAIRYTAANKWIWKQRKATATTK
jgi:dolichol-phosphate mannosyltransferase